MVSLGIPKNCCAWINSNAVGSCAKFVVMWYFFGGCRKTQIWRLPRYLLVSFCETAPVWQKLQNGQQAAISWSPSPNHNSSVTSTKLEIRDFNEYFMWSLQCAREGCRQKLPTELYDYFYWLAITGGFNLQALMSCNRNDGKWFAVTVPNI